MKHVRIFKNEDEFKKELKNDNIALPYIAFIKDSERTAFTKIEETFIKVDEDSLLIDENNTYIISIN